MSPRSLAGRARCAAVARRATVLIMEDRPLSARLATHVDRCLNCQAEAAHARALRRGLAVLRHPVEPAPEQMARLVLAGLDAPLPVRRGGSRRRVVPTVAAAAAAAAVAVLVMRRRTAA